MGGVWRVFVVFCCFVVGGVWFGETVKPCEDLAKQVCYDRKEGKPKSRAGCIVGWLGLSPQVNNLRIGC